MSIMNLSKMYLILMPRRARGYILVQTEHSDLNTLLERGSETHNVNIAIAAATSSYSRMRFARCSV